MDAQQNLQVKLISSEFVKPSSPTPSSHKFFTLSYLDIFSPSNQVPFNLVYENSTTATNVATQPNDDIVPGLKSALAETLTPFYPLAGGSIIDDDYTILCDDQGVLFNETRVDCRLSDVLNSPCKLDLFGKFVPTVEASNFIQLSFQINVFQCGGIIIGCSFSHKLLDASSLSCFLNHWAAIASKRYDSLVQPNFKVIVAAFPPPPPPPPPKEETHVAATPKNNVTMLSHRPKPIKVVGKSFIFSRVVIDQLKGKAATTALPYPTGFEVVAGFVWQNLMGIVALEDEQPVPTVVYSRVNIRPRTKPPLPKESMGNLAIDLYVGADKCGELSDHVAEIHTAILTVVKKVETMQGENGAEAYLAEKEIGFKGLVKDTTRKPTMYHLGNWCRLGINEVNFGFGKPSKIIPIGTIHPYLRNTMAFLDYSDSDGNGIEAWLFLEEKEMQVLESNQQFRAFASSGW